jgi:acyl-CoA synthetase (AMP-forming)/AMP-acid ligase II
MAREARASLASYESYPFQRVLQRTADRLPDKVAVIDGERRFTYRDLDGHSSRLAAALASLGVAKGDRVGLLAPNCAEFVIAFYGILKVGAVATTINSGYREREIAHQLNDCGARVLIVHEALLGMADSARDATAGLERLIAIKEGSDDADSFWGLIEHAQATPPSVAIEPSDDLAALPYSSGTTGLSKGVMLTHFNLAANLRQLVERPGEAAGFTSDDVILVHLPMFHIYGLQVLMNAAIAAGGTQVLMGRFDMELFLGLMSRHRVTWMCTVPPVALGLTSYPDLGAYDLSSLKVGLCAAAPLSADLQIRLREAIGFPIIQGYGMTETAPLLNLDFIERDRIRPGSVGPAAADTEEKVVDLETGTSEVAPGDIGELIVRGPQVMKGYYDNPRATKDTLSESGWLHTGDVVRMDPDGYVRIVDRKKELIKYRGFQVPPAELEGLLLEHPAVADAAVIGKPEVESGEIPKAFVVRKAGRDASDEDLMEFVAGKVATFKHVREVQFVDAIPKNPSGKILRRMLIEQERARAGTF